MLRLAVFVPAFIREREQQRQRDLNAEELGGQGDPGASLGQRAQPNSEDGNEKSHAETEEDGRGSDENAEGGGEARSVFQSSGSVARDRGQDDEEDEYKIKHRYLPIISGLACPFSVLLDVGTFAISGSGFPAD